MQNPSPLSEYLRLKSLSDYDVDFSKKNVNLDNLSRLASSIAGTEISLVNLIDNNTQWSVGSYGIDIRQMPREESICQFTIEGNEDLEVDNLADDIRFKDKFYVSDDPFLKYYFGIPLVNSEGFPLGALCVMDKNKKHLDELKREQLHIIAEEVVEKLEDEKRLNHIQQELDDMKLSQKKVAHDIRGPLGGIYGITEVIESELNGITDKELMEFLNLIKLSSRNLLELSDDLMKGKHDLKRPENNGDELTIEGLKDKLDGLYQVQAYRKEISLKVNISSNHHPLPFQKAKVLQIIGNLISNAIKFTPVYGKVDVELDIKVLNQKAQLLVQVHDTGIGISKEKLTMIVSGQSDSIEGTMGEHGYGFGLNLVKYLVESLHGEIHIESSLGTGTSVSVKLPLNGKD